MTDFLLVVPMDTIVNAANKAVSDTTKLVIGASLLVAALGMLGVAIKTKFAIGPLVVMGLTVGFFSWLIMSIPAARDAVGATFSSWGIG